MATNTEFLVWLVNMGLLENMINDTPVYNYEFSSRNFNTLKIEDWGSSAEIIHEKLSFEIDFNDIFILNDGVSLS